jgi:hypothetical protein
MAEAYETSKNKVGESMYQGRLDMYVARDDKNLDSEKIKNLNKEYLNLTSRLKTTIKLRISTKDALN